MKSGLSLEKRIRIFWHSISGRLNLAFYTRKQNYRVKYQVEVLNASDQVRNFQILLPVPLSNEYQTVTKQPSFNLNDFKLITDKDFGNVAAMYSGEIGARQRVILRQDFEVEVSPRTISKPSDEMMSLRSCRHFKNETMKELNNENNLVDEDLLTLKKLNDEVVSKLVYGDAISGLYTSEEVLKREKVDCGGFDTLLASMAQEKGYAARVVSGFWAGYEKNTMHAWLEVQLPDGRVVPLDPSVEKLASQGRTTKSGKFGFVGSDRIVFSRGCCLPFQINGQEMTVELLQHPFLLPHDPDLRYSLDAKVETL